ncbi:MAG: TlpA family protein disulfide reductase [Halioglobus sp.]|nr:TlpA family protein disulfide reductase [Halioglobus sp.]
MKNLILCLLAITVAACGQRTDTAASPQDALQQLRGQWVVINYWAQWCKPCIEEIPELNTLDSEYPDVTVLGVNYDGATGDELEQQRQQLGVTFTSLAQDPAAQLGQARPVVLPTTFVLNPQGDLMETLIGPQTLESLVQATQQAER